MDKYMIVARCDALNAKLLWHGEKVLRYEGTTPVEWIHEKGLTREEAHDTFVDWVRNLGDLFYYDDLDAEASKIWYEGPGFYDGCGGERVYAINDDYFKDGAITYVAVPEDDYLVRRDTQIYKEIYKKGAEVTDKEKAIITAVNGKEVSSNCDREHELHAFAIGYSQEYGVGEALVALLNELQAADGGECLWYLGDIHEEYVYKR